MFVEPSATLEKQATPEISYWQSCKSKAKILNIPAWMIAEENFVHSNKREDRTSK